MDPHDEWVTRVLQFTIPPSQSENRAKDAAREIAESGGGVIYGKLRLDFDSAFKSAQSHLATFGQKILSSPEAKTYPQRDELAEVAGRLGAFLPEFGSGLIDLLDEARQAPADQRPAIRAKAVAEIDRYRTMLDDEPILLELENTPLGPAGAYTAMADALASLRTQLS